MNRLAFGPGARLAALQAVSFAGLGIWMPFFPVWLGERGVGADAIGVILALPIVVRIVAVAPLMSLVDRGVGARRLIAGACLGSALLYLVLLRAEGVVALGALVALLAVTQAPVIPASDLVTLQEVRRDPRLDYGRIRLWGSISFLATSAGGGMLLGQLPADATIWILIGLAVVALATALAVVPDTAPAHPAPGPAGAAGSRARLPSSLWLVIAAGACTQASHAALYAFGSLHWRDLGFSSATVGWLWAISVVTEILVFGALGRDVGRGAAFRLILIGAGAAVFRFTALASDPGLIPTLALQVLHGLTFAATHLGTMAAFALLAPEGARGRAQGFMSAAMALAMAAGTVASGPVFRAAGPLVFLAMVPLAAAGFVLTLLAMRAYRSQPHRAGQGGWTRPPS
ncbi:MAG TPA: MFS transporter [Beijerinckiaceae bacterium]|jgi:PPP family 3-phenylpropionic acid transporter